MVCWAQLRKLLLTALPERETTFINIKFKRSALCELPIYTASYNQYINTYT